MSPTDAAGAERQPAEATLSLAEVEALARTVLLANGVSSTQADPIVRTVTWAERDDCRSHGLHRLINYVRSIRLGLADGVAEPTVHDDGGALVRVEAGRGFAPLAFDRGRPVLIDKARRLGIAALAIRNCHHNSALWAEVEPLARDDRLTALAFNPSHSWVAPAGGHAPLFGTNPFAFSWPRPGRDPFVFDFATSAIARGEIELHALAGKPVPLGWVVDAEGEPTTDPLKGLAGAMLPFGGHKGTAIQVMIELLAGALIGDKMSFESLAHDGGHGAVPLHGELIIALDPDRFRAGHGMDAAAAGEGLFRLFGDQKGARLASDRRYAARQRTTQDGVRVPCALLGRLHDLCETGHGART